MTRQEMENVINSGGSVLHEGKLHTRIETLPSKGALAKTAEEKQTALSDIDAKMAELQAQKDALSEAGEDEQVTLENLKKLPKGKLQEEATAQKLEFDEKNDRRPAC